MNSILQDIRFALRRMRRSPGFVATAVLTLALGIGATTAIFTLVYQVILRSLPVEHPDQLYKIGKGDDCCVTSGLQDPWNLFSYDLYQQLRDGTPGTQGIAAVSAREFSISARRPGKDSGSQALGMEYASGNYFPLLRMEPYAGRLLQPEDDREGAAPVAVVSYSLWQTKFAADPRLVGSTLLLSGYPFTVVGITASNFLSERNKTDPAGVWVPLAQELTLDPDQKLLRMPGMHWLDLLVRIPDPRGLATVQAAVQTSLRQWVMAHPETTQNATLDQMRRVTTEIVSARGGINNLRGEYGKNLHLLLLIASFVLLIACANLANLLLVRGMARAGELALCSAMGAPRARLIRQTLAEAVLLALCGGAVALPLAYAGTRAILALAFGRAGVSPLSAAPSLPVLCFALGVSLLTGVLFGIAPAWMASRFGPLEALRGANRSTGDASALPQRCLVILQAALSLALLSTAGLLITSLRHLERQDFHFEPHGRLVVYTDLTAAGYTAEKLPAFDVQMEDVLRRLPSVEHFGYATYAPMTGSNWSTGVWFPGEGPKGQLAGYLAASTDYFQAVGTHTIQGRVFTSEDTATSAHVAVVNEAFASKFLHGRQPVGLRFGPVPEMRNEFSIIGVVENTQYGDPAASSLPMFFIPMTQTTVFVRPQDAAVASAVHFPSNLIVQYRGDSATAAKQIREALQSINPDIPLLQMTTYDDVLSSNFTEEELVVRLTTLFGLLALLLASIGVYGVTAYTVTRRTGEIGVRMALGASRGHVLRMVMQGALSQALVGLALGVPLSLLAGHLLAHSLYQTMAVQPVVLLSVIALLLLAAACAALVPAKNAASVDPMHALRSQ